MLRGLTAIGYGTYSHMYSSAESHERVLLGGELDHDISRVFAIATGGEWASTASVSNDAELFAELDAALPPGSWGALTLGAIAYYDWTKPTGGSRSGGATFGTTANWQTPSETRILMEYDFRSAFNGEDGFSAKLVQALGAFEGHSTQAIIGLAKHRVLSVTLKISLARTK